MKRKVLAYWSAPGNSRFIAEQFEGFELHDMRFTDSLPDDTDTLGLVFPVYYGGLPRPVEDFLERVIMDRDNSEVGYIFAVLTYGGNRGFSYSSLSQKLGECGCALSYVNSVLMPDCYLPMVPRAVSPAERDATVREALEKLAVMKDEIRSEKFALAKVGLTYRLFRSWGKKGRTPGENPELVVSDRCTGCGRCVDICPMDNIKIEDGAARHGSECISCFACYHSCPENALTYPKAEGQYEPPRTIRGELN